MCIRITTTTVCLIIRYILKSILLLVATQKIPRIVIAHPGQDVELLCTVTMTSGNPTVSWMINNMMPIGLGTLHGGRLAGYSSNGNNLIVENVTMNDVRNGSYHNCLITSRIAILRQSYSTILYIAGKYYLHNMHMYEHATAAMYGKYSKTHSAKVGLNRVTFC